MKPVDQTQFAGEGAGGDCVRASVASLLEVPIDAVPHFLEVGAAPELWEIEFLEWLEERGVTVWREAGHYAFEGYYLASGPAERGVNHMVVYRDGKLAHDPHPSRAGLLDVKWSRMLVPLDPSVLAAAIRGTPPMTATGVKTMDWHRHDSHAEIAETPFGPYLVEPVGGGAWAWMPDATKNARRRVEVASIEAAKALCLDDLNTLLARPDPADIA